jgi:hypothetical protein
MIEKEFLPGEPVLLRNNQLEDTVSIARKVDNQYMGPYQVVRQTRGGSYILAEMDRTPLRTTVAAFCLIPYIRRKMLEGGQRTGVIKEN